MPITGTMVCNTDRFRSLISSGLDPGMRQAVLFAFSAGAFA